MEQLQGVHAADFGQHGVIAYPFQPEGQNRAQHTQGEALHHEGQPDKAVGGAHHFHDGDFVPPVIHGQLDGVGDNQKADHQKHRDDGHGDDVQHALNGGEALRQLVGRAGLDHAGQLLELLVGLLHLGVVLQSDHIAVAQIRGLHAVEGAVVVVILHEVLQGFLPGNEGGLQNVVQQVDLGADGAGLGVGQAAVDVHQDFTGLI